MARAKRPVSIDGMEFDALISEEHTLEATVPEYAVEDGYSVSDTIILGQDTISMVLFLTDMPVTWESTHGVGTGRVDDIIKKLQEKYYERTTVTIVTTDNTYTDMAIESITISKTAEVGYAKEIPLSFRKIRKTTTAVTSIPASYGKSGATGANAGTASKSGGSSGGGSSSSGGGSSSSGSSSSSSSSSSGSGKSSILYSIGKSTGLIK